jgi:hypothetical protein
MADKKQNAEVQAGTDPVVFSKERVLKMKRYSNRRDLLGALLKEDQTYALNDVDALVEKFLKG